MSKCIIIELILFYRMQNQSKNLRYGVIKVCELQDMQGSESVRTRCDFSRLFLGETAAVV